MAARKDTKSFANTTAVDSGGGNRARCTNAKSRGCDVPYSPARKPPNPLPVKGLADLFGGVLECGKKFHRLRNAHTRHRAVYGNGRNHAILIVDHWHRQAANARQIFFIVDREAAATYFGEVELQLTQ